MSEEKYQKELFEFNQPKKPFSRFSDMLPKADFEGRVSLTLSIEKIAFITIGIIMAMVIVYALGVESGKARAKASAVINTKPIGRPAAIPAVQPPAITIPAKNILSTAPIVPIARHVTPVTLPGLKAGGLHSSGANPACVHPGLKSGALGSGVKQTAQGQAKSADNLKGMKYFTIIAGTYTKWENAEASRALLTRQGFNVTVIRDRSYYRICVGEYINKNGVEAQRDLAKIKRIRKDAMFIQKTGT